MSNRVDVAVRIPEELAEWARERRLNLSAVLIVALQKKVKSEKKGVKNENNC